MQGVSRLTHGGCINVPLSSANSPQPVFETYVETERVLNSVSADSDSNRCTRTFERLLCESLHREQLNDDVALMLSGGYDSKAIATVARKHFDVSLQTLTHGDANSRDISGAKTTAKGLGFQHRVAKYDSWDLSTYARLLTSLAGGAAGLQVSQHLPGYELAGAHAKVAMVGFLGGGLSGGIPQSSRSTKTHASKVVLKRLGLEPAMERVFADEIDDLKVQLRDQYRLYPSFPNGVST